MHFITTLTLYGAEPDKEGTNRLYTWTAFFAYGAIAKKIMKHPYSNPVLDDDDDDDFN